MGNIASMYCERSKPHANWYGICAVIHHGRVHMMDDDSFCQIALHQQILHKQMYFVYWVEEF